MLCCCFLHVFARFCTFPLFPFVLEPTPSAVRPTRHRLPAPGTRARVGSRAEGAPHARAAGSGRWHGSVGGPRNGHCTRPMGAGNRSGPSWHAWSSRPRSSPARARHSWVHGSSTGELLVRTYTHTFHHTCALFHISVGISVPGVTERSVSESLTWASGFLPNGNEGRFRSQSQTGKN